MGQKVSPIGLRVGINKDWESRWYASSKDFSKYLIADMEIRKYLDKKLKNAAVSKIEIERNKKRTEVIIHTAKPGIVIGRGGEEIEKMKKDLSKVVNQDLQISVIEIKNPNLVAKIVADTIAHQIENRASFRMAQKKAIKNTMRAGAKGIKTNVSGRLGGVEMARSEKYTEGNIPLHTLRADIDYAASEADTTYGKIGVKVWIYKGEILNKKKDKGANKDVDAKKN
ncbi:MAG: 30S ribosomal protein S3 [Bacilli bacterium]